MKVEVKVCQSCPALCDPVDYTVHGILLARILEWVAISLTQGMNPGLPHCRQILYQLMHKGSPLSSVGKESACNVGDPGSIPGLGRSPGEGKGYPLQYSGLENSMDCIVHRVTKSRTRRHDFNFHFYF